MQCDKITLKIVKLSKHKSAYETDQGRLAIYTVMWGCVDW